MGKLMYLTSFAEHFAAFAEMQDSFFLLVIKTILHLYKPRYKRRLLHPVDLN